MAKRWLTLFFSILFLPQLVSAQKMVDIYGGYSDTASATVTATQYPWIGSSVSASETIDGSSGLFGMRIVGCFDPEDNSWMDPEKTLKEGSNYSWLGGSVDIFGFRAHGENTESTTVAIAFNAMFRYPGDTFQPYFGMGILMHESEISVSEKSALGKAMSGSGYGMGLDLSTGLLWSVHSRVSLFAEYRYTSLSIDYDSTDDDLVLFGGESIHTNLKTNHFLAGLSFPF